jgi:Leucine-rich repeat (LRR) protein
MELPELRLHVGRYLTINDLASCVLVNKLWHDTFLPYLYHKCDTNVNIRHWPSFKNNLHHTRELDISYNTLKHSDEKSAALQKCTHLRKLSLNAAHTNMKFFLQLIQQNPRLCRVDLAVGEVTELDTPTTLKIKPTSCAVTFLDTMARSCPRLTELGVDMMLHPESEKKFYNSFSRHFMPRLTKLYWAWFRVRRVKTSPWMIDKYGLPGEKRNDDRCSFPELRVLTVYICVLDTPHPWEEEIMLFENSPNLEVLSWSWDPSPLFGVGSQDPSLNIDQFFHTLCKFIATRWFKLHSISLSIKKSDTHIFQDEHISRVLKTMRNPLRRFELRNGNPCTKQTWQALRQHIKTIHTLHLSSETGMALSSSEIEEVLSTGHRLIDFQHDSVLNASDVTSGMIIDRHSCNVSLLSILTTPLISQGTSVSSLPCHFQYPWICHRLQVLKIVLLRHSEDYLNFAVFAQLAKMKELRVLHISSPSRGPEYGLNPGGYLFDLTDAESLPFEGHYSSYNQIRDHPVGKRLLFIWPGLTNCYWYNI